MKEKEADVCRNKEIPVHHITMTQIHLPTSSLIKEKENTLFPDFKPFKNNLLIGSCQMSGSCHFP